MGNDPTTIADPSVFLIMSFVVLAAFIVLVSNVAKVEKDGGVDRKEKTASVFKLDRMTGEWIPIEYEDEQSDITGMGPIVVRLTDEEVASWKKSGRMPGDAASIDQSERNV